MHEVGVPRGNKITDNIDLADAFEVNRFVNTLASTNS